MRIRRLNESVKYKGEGRGACPVCGNYKNLKETQSVPDTDGMEYNYECPICEFKWYSKYSMVYDAEYNWDGEEIFVGNDVNPEHYNKEKLDKYLAIKKFNL